MYIQGSTYPNMKLIFIFLILKICPIHVEWKMLRDRGPEDWIRDGFANGQLGSADQELRGP